MASEPRDPGTAAFDLGEYCREVEACLTRVNEGQLVRIAGSGFVVVRAWALAGIPLSIVCAGVEQKAERHRTGRATRPLRIEFCDEDVRAVYAAWCRAVGLPRGADGPVEGPAAADGETSASVRRPSLTKHLDRAMNRLSGLAGRLDLPEALIEAVNQVMAEAAHLRDEAAALRGAAREALSVRLPALDGTLLEAADGALEAEDRDRLRQAAEADLRAYRDRLDEAAWERSVRLGVERLLRDRFGLPTFAPGS